ncbi:tetratricopeptide repeat protein [Rickettsiales bacterium]|nr:tetratricopeptide repeat protein [Rickettsiales bacterium]MDB2550805.1 tetratricopeptide repeat protein [Rickettsiales bacterium]
MIKYIILLIFAITTNSIADQLPSNQEIIGNIERHLFFNDETGQVENNDASYDGDNTIFDEDEEYEPKFDIITVDANFNKDSEQKKKLAYNTNLIGHYEVAIKLYQEILDQDIEEEDAKFGLAFAYQKLHQYNEAKDLYYNLLNQGKKIDKNKIVSNLLSIIIEESPKEAIFFLTKLSAQHPDSSDLIAKSALTYAKINRTEKAIDLMQKALSLNPSNYQYQYNLAIMLDEKGDYENAKLLYDRILLKLTRTKSEELGISLDEIYTRAQYLEKML